MRKRKLLEKILYGSKNIRFAEATDGRSIMKDYHINIFYSDDDDGYIADIPDLRHCSAFGETPDEALSEVLKAKKAWLATAHANKKPIPKPHYRPVIYQVA
jgi:predicted RNase H-like HicB family nuclease